MLHEAAHAWFNGGFVADRWMAEGFASYYASRAGLRVAVVDRGPVAGGTTGAGEGNLGPRRSRQNCERDKHYQCPDCCAH